MQVNSKATFGLLGAQIVPGDFGLLLGGQGRHEFTSDCSQGGKAGPEVFSWQLPIIYPISEPD